VRSARTLGDAPEQSGIVSDVTRSSRSRSLTAAQDAHFGARAASWTDRYRSSPSFHAQLNVIGRAIDDVLRYRREARVLDFGEGTRVFSAVPSRSASFTVCVDRSQPMLVSGIADQPSMVAMLASEGFGGSLGTVVRIAGDDRCVGSLRSSFDLILAIATVEYISDVAALLTRLAQALGQGGTLLITVPNRTSPVRIAQWIARPLLARRPTTTGWLADQSFVRLRPHGDGLPWRRAAIAAGLVVKWQSAVPLGLSGVRRWFHPTLLVSLRRPKDHCG
jgi:SAM-dependent methyltransferase